MNKNNIILWFISSLLFYKLGLWVGYNTQHLYMFPVLTVAFTVGFLIAFVPRK